MISIAEKISVPSPPDTVWTVVSDPSDVVACIAGAELGAAHDDGSFDGTLVVKFSALRVKFAARLTLDLDEGEHEGRLSARGRDGQGATRFSGGATFRVVPGPDSGHSLVAMTGEVNLTGKLASLIESGAGVVVSRMTKEFSAALVERCANPATPPVEPAVTLLPAAGLLARLRAWWTRLVQSSTQEVTNGTAKTQ